MFDNLNQCYNTLFLFVTHFLATRHMFECGQLVCDSVFPQTMYKVGWSMMPSFTKSAKCSKICFVVNSSCLNLTKKGP